MDRQEFADHVVTRYNQDPNGQLAEVGRKFLQSDKFSIRIVEKDIDLSRFESIFGTPFGASQDYGRRWDVIVEGETDNQWANKGNSSKDDLIEEVRNRISSHPRQIDFYLKDENMVVGGLVVDLKKTGYVIHPDEEELIEPTI